MKLYEKAEHGESTLFGNKKRKQFERLFQPHLDAAYNLARYLSGNDNDAEDIVQEAYLKAYRAFDSYIDTNARSWVLTITRNTCYSWMQQHRQSLYQSISFDEQSTNNLTEEYFDELQNILSPEQEIEKMYSQHLVVQAIEALPVEYKETIVLREMSGLSYKEIAKVIGIPQGTVMSRLARARSRLAKQWERHKGEEL